MSCLRLASVTVAPCKYVQATCVAQVCPGSADCVGCNTQHNVDNLTLRLVVACIAQGYVGSILPKPEPNETLMIPGT